MVVVTGAGHGRRAATFLSPLLAHADLLFLGGTLRTAFAALATGTTLTVGVATTRAAGAPGRPHLLQLLELLRRQDLLELRLHLSLQGRHLLLLIGGEVQLLLCAWGQEVKPTLPARTVPRTPLCAGFRRRTLPVLGLIIVLCREEAR